MVVEAFLWHGPNENQLEASQPTFYVLLISRLKEQFTCHKLQHNLQNTQYDAHVTEPQ